MSEVVVLKLSVATKVCLSCSKECGKDHAVQTQTPTPPRSVIGTASSSLPRRRLVGAPNRAAVLGKAISAGELLANCPSVISSLPRARSAQAAASPSSCKTPMSPDTLAKLKLHSAQQSGEDLGNRFVYVLCGYASAMHNCTVLVFGKCHLVFIFFHSIIHHLHPHRFTVQLPFCFQDNFSYTECVLIYFN